MKKIFGIALVLAVLTTLCFGTVALAADPPEGVVNVNASGTNGSVSITTVAPYVNDTLTLTTTGTFAVSQSNRFVPTGPWTGDGNDIDRTATFVGNGSVSTTTNYLSTDAWALAAANLNTSVTASGSGATGTIHQNLYFDQNYGGVYTQSQWAKQRNMEIYAGGDYVLTVSNIGASIAPSLGSMPSGSLPAYEFEIIAASATGNAGLHFDNTLSTTGYQALSNNGDHGTYTGVSANFVFAYTNSPVVDITTQTVIGGSIAIIEDFLNRTISGSGTIQ